MAVEYDTLPDHTSLRTLRYLMRVGALPPAVGLHQITVYHDDWCGICSELITSAALLDYIADLDLH